MRAAPPAHHLTRVLAEVERAASADGRQVPRPVRRRAPDHGRHAAQQLVGGEPQLAAAHLLHLAPPPRRRIPGLAAVLPESPPPCAQPARRAPGQEPAGGDDRPGPSALAHPAGPGTASAPAGVTRGRPAASRTGHIARRYPALTGRHSSCARVTQKWLILNHATLAHPAGLGTASAPAGLTTGRRAASRTGHPFRWQSGPHRPALSACLCNPKTADSEPRLSRREPLLSSVLRGLLSYGGPIVARCAVRRADPVGQSAR